MDIEDIKIKEKIVLALDVDNFEEAKNLITELKDYVGVFKVGLQLYTACGNEIIDLMQKESVNIFFDVKLMDIPNTVKKASENIVKRGASFFNVHTLGGKEMMRAAKDSAEKFSNNSTVLGVTLLTSLNNETLKLELEIPFLAEDYVIKLAKLAKESGLDGVVASVWECKKIKEACGKDFKVLTPAIRPIWADKNEQKRVSTPSFAIEQGADYIVLGRAITNAENKIEAMKKVYEEIKCKN